MRRDTIFALSSGRSRAAISVLRISGPAAAQVAAEMAGMLPEPRRASLRALRRARTGELLDRGLVLWFPGPDTATGEDLVEFHVHGAPAVVAAIVGSLAEFPGLCPAEPGEFTRRAFENGRLGLTEVEGLADLLAAETDAQRRQAMAQFEGRLGARYDEWRAKLLRALAHVEAEIDFSDEELPPSLIAGVLAQVNGLAEQIGAHLDDSGRGERLRDGVSIVVLGAPNAGKSSLVNGLARREVAIVSDEPGTTRDALEVHLDLGGCPATLVDTAGLREAAAGQIETEGIRRARARAANADLKLVLFDSGLWPDLDAESLALVDRDAIPVLSKADQVARGDVAGLAAPSIGGVEAAVVSVLTGAGMDGLIDRMRIAVERLTGTGEALVLTRARHRTLLRDCQAHLFRFVAEWDKKGLELAAEDLRLAARALGRLTGRIDVEDLLDSIFSEFCIGK